MKVYLIRHGRTQGNMEKRYVGTTDEPLTGDAVRELERMRERRTARETVEVYEPMHDIIFASPLRRCIQTAQLLFPERELQIIEDLRECDFGEFEYKNYQELSGDPRYQAFIDSGGTLPFPGGESRRKFADRCCDAFVRACELAMQSGCGSAVFVVHGGTIMAVMERFAVPSRPYFDWQVKNAQGFAGELVKITDLVRDAGASATAAGAEPSVPFAIIQVRQFAKEKERGKQQSKAWCS